MSSARTQRWWKQLLPRGASEAGPTPGPPSLCSPRHRVPGPGPTAVPLERRPGRTGAGGRAFRAHTFRLPHLPQLSILPGKRVCPVRELRRPRCQKEAPGGSKRPRASTTVHERPQHPLASIPSALAARRPHPVCLKRHRWRFLLWVRCCLRQIFSECLLCSRHWEPGGKYVDVPLRESCTMGPRTVNRQ